jgi:hypothetical protein
VTGVAVTGVAHTPAAPGSGPAVAWLFHRVLAGIFVVAWLSLGWQVDVLIGSRGLLPIGSYLAANPGLSATEFPTVFLLGASDTALHAGIWLGAGLSLAALLGLWPRLCTGFSTLLYLSYAAASRTFLSFQWDNLLLECGALAVFLPTDRPARWIHVLFRVLLFKLYWESGIAKWQSYLGDWHDGSAMTWYYQTAPLPAWPAWYAHHLPVLWHHLESWGVLVLELVLPLGIFAPRPIRLALFAVFSAFQLVNLATANYGFFVYLALALHLFLLDDGDVARLARRRSGIAPRRVAATPPAWLRAARAAVAALVSVVYISISLLSALVAFVPLPAPLQPLIVAVHQAYAPWRLVNTYHLFGHITRERVEPEFQIEVDGTWQPFHLHHKPGDVMRAPDLVAPHQPRIDFQLWFYGLSFRRGMPTYVGALLEHLCRDPASVQSLFAGALPAQPAAVRIVFWDYRFTSPTTRRETGAWWERQQVAETHPLRCAQVRP